EVEDWLAEARPHAVVLAAAKVGGILANDRYPADFLQDNLQMETNVIAAAQRLGVEKLVFLGSSCIYPKHAEQPLTEDALLTGPLEPTNQWYAVAKIAGIKLCQAHRRQHGVDFVSAMPTNLYGPGDTFHPEHSHVIPALIRRFHEAKVNGDREVTVWGSGTPMREFLYVDDCADAVVHILKHYSGEHHLNVGTGADVTIRQLAETIKQVVGFEGELVWDTTKPDGTPRKVLDVARINALGWRAQVDLETGLARTYDWYLRHIDEARTV
ncbi:GDP-L-fucose synthase family protein, partial [Rhodovibrio sodomensis]|uniref:GDP-L-fucose synthase family protein n=1 Tax=Rhodovibrio sodomensis TaxID=1088 RepID=UPI001F5BB7CB